MKSSTKRASPKAASKKRKALHYGLSASQVAEDRVARAVVFVMADVDPSCNDALHAAGFDVAPLQKEAVAKAFASGDLPCVLMWSDPTNCLAGALEEGAGTAEALEAWRERAQEILALVRKNRRKLTLVDADVLTLPDKDPAWEVLRKRLDLPSGLVVRQATAQASSTLSRAVARLAVSQIDSLRELLEELRASGVSSLTEGGAIANLEAAAAAFQDLRSSREDVALLAAQVKLQVEKENEGNQERDLLHSQVRLVTGEIQRLKTVETAFETQKQERDAEQEEIVLLREQVRMHVQEAQRSADENAALLDKLAGVNQDLTQHKAGQNALVARHAQALRDKDQVLAQTVQHLSDAKTRHAELEAKNAKLARDVEDLTTMLTLVYESTSWRVTAPLRGVRRLVSK